MKIVNKHSCSISHTSYQPTDEEWKCPKCGAGFGEFVIEEGGDGVSDDCELLHTTDECRCYACGYTASGSTVAKRLKALNQPMVKCECCKGRGWVPEK